MQLPYSSSKSVLEIDRLFDAAHKFKIGSVPRQLLKVRIKNKKAPLILPRLCPQINSLSLATTFDRTQAFLVEALEVSWESQGDLGEIYPLLLENIDLLEPGFIYVLQQWSAFAFSVVSPEQAATIAGLLADLAGIIWGLPDGDREITGEIAIACCQIALQAYSLKQFPGEWAVVQNNLALAYSTRSCGDSVENDRQSYACYYLGKQVFPQQVFPQEWERIIF